MPRAALFDMDRTLVRKETASLYVKYQRRIGEAKRRDVLRVTYWALQYTLGVIDMESIATRVVKRYAGTSEAKMTAVCDAWFQTDVLPHVCDAGRDAVKKHHAAGDVVAIVTGASHYASRPLARVLDIEHVVASTFEVDDSGMFTGNVVQPLCFGPGKLERARELAKTLGFALEEAAFYTDSITDLPLLDAVAERICVNPDPRLRRLARARGWRIESW
jgi:HAD superfamily hydrolase (TIGR01490 family)